MEILCSPDLLEADRLLGCMTGSVVHVSLCRHTFLLISRCTQSFNKLPGSASESMSEEKDYMAGMMRRLNFIACFETIQ